MHTTHAPPMHRCHARPSLPVNQIPNPTPPTQGAFRLHDTAAEWSWYKRVFCNNTKSLAKLNDNNFINESYLFTQGKTIVKAYTTTAREPSIYAHTCRIQIQPSLARTYLKPKTWRITRPHDQLSSASQAKLCRTWKPTKIILGRILILWLTCFTQSVCITLSQAKYGDITQTPGLPLHTNL